MPEQALRETIRVQDGAVPLLERHLDRLRAGGCDEAIIATVRAEATAAAEAWYADFGRMSLTVTSDGTVAAIVTPTPSSIVVEGNPVAKLIEAKTPPLPAGAAKPADRSFWDAALHKAQLAGAHVAILTDSSGRITDGSQATVWLRFGDTLVTPTSPPALAGVSRGLILDLASEVGYGVEERDLSVEEYESADEVFLSTAVGGVASVRGREGEAAPRLNELFDEAFGVNDQSP